MVDTDPTRTESRAVTRRDLDELHAMRSEDGIVSAYIGIEPRLRYERDQHEMKFKGAVKRFARRAGDRERAVLEREGDRILDYLRGVEPEGRGLAIFSSTPADIWKVLTIDVRVPTWVDVDATPNTGLLARVLDEYPRFAIVVVQRDKAAVYTAVQRAMVEQADVESNVPGQHDEGGWSQARFQRHIEVHVDRHLQKLVDELQALYHDQPFRRLVIGGTDENVAELRDKLPEPIARRVIGSFGVDFKHDTERDLLRSAAAVLEEDERRAERELVESIANAAASQGRGAIGIDDTLRALQEGRVEILAVADGVTLEGYECAECGYFAAHEAAECPACRGGMEPLGDVVERAIERAYESDAHVETVFGEARESLLARGGLGAALRF